MATFPSKVNYATGDILTATNMNDVGGAINLLQSAQFSAGKNAVINSAMNVWQRGTSSLAAATSTATGFTADRWQLYRASFGANVSVSRQATGDTANLPNIQYGARVQRTAADTSTAFIRFLTTFETVNSIPMAGKTATISFYAKAGANFSAANNALFINIDYGTGTDQNYISGFTGSTSINATYATLTTTYQRFTATFAIPSTATQLAVYFSASPTGTAGANDWFEVTGVQLEAASTASPYAPNGATYQAELAACQRYYFRAGTNDSAAYGALANAAFAQSATTVISAVALPVQMRIAPSSVDFSNVGYRQASGTTIAMSGITLDTTQTSATIGNVYGTVSATTINLPGFLSKNNNSAGYLGFSAEL